MPAPRELQAYCVRALRISVNRSEDGEPEIRLQHGEAEPFRATVDDVARIQEALEQAELFIRYQQQLSRQWCPTCGEASEL